MQQTNITSFEELIEYIENSDISVKDIGRITQESLDLRIVFDKDKEEVIKDLKEYWSEWKDVPERPLFLEQRELKFSIKDFFQPGEQIATRKLK